MNIEDTLKQYFERFNPQWNLIENLYYFQETVEKEVPGWFYVYDHAIFHCVLNTMQHDVSGDICEIGVANGKSAIALSNYKSSSEKLYLYDIFLEEDRIIAENNIKRFGTFENIDWRLGDTTLLTAKTLGIDTSLRFLHIDGSHEHTAVYSDLCVFGDKMADGGIIVMDDFNDYEYPGVKSGTMKFLLENPKWMMFAIGQNKAYLCKQSHYDRYINALITCMENCDVNAVRFTPALRDVNDHLILLSCSRETWSYQRIRNTLYSSYAALRLKNN